MFLVVLRRAGPRVHQKYGTIEEDLFGLGLRDPVSFPALGGISVIPQEASERRHQMGESDTAINQKLRLALQEGLRVILCIGETKDERKSNRMERVFARHISAGLAGMTVLWCG